MSPQNEDVPLYRTLRSWSLKVLHFTISKDEKEIDRVALSEVLKDGGDELERLTKIYDEVNVGLRKMGATELASAVELSKKNAELTTTLAASQALVTKLETHPCYDKESGEFDHDWKHVDDSFSHEFGTETLGHLECQRCDAHASDEDYRFDHAEDE